MGQPPGDATDHRLIQALDHPVRAGFLRLLASRRVLSPSEALPLLDGTGLVLGNVVYHVRVLDQFELVEPVGEPEPQRGHRFRPTARGEDVLAALGLPSDEQESE